MKKRESIKSESEKRFEFGSNWKNYLNKITEDRIIIAENSLKSILELQDLQSMYFLDIGSGSGLFSLAARRLGATVISFDYDDLSVRCTSELKQCYFPNDEKWIVHQGDILDENIKKKYFESADIVYSWGVLHHTGDLWTALENACCCVKHGGKLWIAIYNDQGWRSKRWLKIKKHYCNGGYITKKCMLFLSGIYLLLFYARDDMHNYGDPFYRLKGKNRKRAMSVSNDLVDWAGGYPFQVAKPEVVFDFCRKHGFVLVTLITQGNGHGNNQFVFEKK